MAIGNRRVLYPELVKERLRRVNRVHVYRPARIWMTWLFLSSIGTLAFGFVSAIHAFQLGSVNALVDALWYVLPLSLFGAWGVSKATLDYLIASGYFLFEGDLGIVNIDSVELRHPILAQTTFIVDTDDKKRYYPPEVYHAKITRYEVWRWGRRGGVWKWPGWDGGKKDGYWAVVQHTWEIAEIPKRNPTGAIVGNEARVFGTPLATVTEFKIDKDGKQQRLVRLDPQVADQIRNKFPGILRGRVLDLRYVVWPNRSPLELPEEVAQSIMSDAEYRASSLVTVGYDPLPAEQSLGTVAPPNALAELWGLQVADKLHVATINNLLEKIAWMQKLMDYTQGGGVSGGPGGVPGGQQLGPR